MGRSNLNVNAILLQEGRQRKGQLSGATAFPLYFFKLYLFTVHGCLACMYVRASQVCLVPAEVEEVSYALELEFQVVVS